jgi:hypothetical protein
MDYNGKRIWVVGCDLLHMAKAPQGHFLWAPWAPRIIGPATRFPLPKVPSEPEKFSASIGYSTGIILRQDEFLLPTLYDTILKVRVV